MIQGNRQESDDEKERSRHDIFQREDDREGLMSTVQSRAANRAEDSTSSEDAPITKEDLDVLANSISAIGYRVEELEESHNNKMPIPLPTPGDGLSEIKAKLTQLINYINIGIRRG